MTNRLTINHTGDQIQLFWQRGNSIARATEPVNFSHPFNTEVLDEIRWYLEKYLGFPYGIEPDKASALEQKLQGWGEALFNLIFCSNEKGRQFFQEATREGLQKCELGISSEDPQLLNLPWELLYCSDYQFCAFVSRYLSQFREFCYQSRNEAVTSRSIKYFVGNCSSLWGK